jgi:Zn finger protein HypA/HybF involved in hydrogenase expression
VDPTDSVADTLATSLRAQVPPSFLVAGIEVHLGALVDLRPDLLHAALAERLPGIEVNITVVPALMRCLDCGAEYPPEEHPCPVCGSTRAVVVHGEELAIVRAWGAEAVV